MEREKKVAVVTDSGSSMKPAESGATVVPLELSFFENGEYRPYSDNEISTGDFYERMAASGQMLPKTAGAVPGGFIENFRRLRETNESIVSINITSKHSGVYDSALQSKDIVLNEPGERTQIEVIDSKFVSRTTAFQVETAIKASDKGATLSEIKDEITEVISKSGLYVTLSTLDNFIKGGRGKDLVAAIVATKLHITPIIEFTEGKLGISDKVWGGFEKARRTMIEKVGDSGKMARLVVIHTNSPVIADSTRESLEKMFKIPVLVFEAGPVLAVHAGQGAIGIGFQKA